LIAVVLGMSSCRDARPTPDAVTRLRAAFPTRSAQVLKAQSQPAPSLSMLLPSRADGEIHFGLPHFSPTVRELDAFGAVDRTGSVVSYARRNGTSFWIPTSTGHEEWLLVELDSSGPSVQLVAEWEVRGATLRQVGQAVELLAGDGIPRITVTAPEAYGPGEKLVPVHLAVAKERIQLWVDRRGVASGPLLIDPVWQPGPLMTQARSGHTATLLLNGTVLVAGGRNQQPLTHASAELFDPAANSWTAVGSMASARHEHTATLLPSGKVLVVGGQIQGTPVIGAELFDPATNSWAQAPDLIERRFGHVAVLLASGKVLIAGGSGPFAGYNNAYLSTVELYDPVANSWSSAAPMAEKRQYAAAVRLGSGKVLVAGGYNSPNTLAPFSTELYDPLTNTWDSAGNLTDARAQVTATLLADGRVLLLNGRNSNLHPLNGEIYDPQTNGWTPTISSGASRFEHAATLLPSGAVVAIGGYKYVSNGSNDDVRSYDPTTGAFTAMAPLSIGRWQLAATLLPNRRVLVTGGVSGGLSQASTELLDTTLGNACTSGADCVTGNCIDDVCCESTCAGACNRCDQANAKGSCIPVLPNTAGAPSCDPYLCNGTSVTCPSSCTADANCLSTHYCSAGSCVLNGTGRAASACRTAVQCASGSCVDGVCCTSTCGEACDSCDVAGSVGICVPIPAGNAGEPSCAPFVCGGSNASCPVTCTSDANCILSHQCASGVCVLKPANGTPCTASIQCASNHCVDGFCCNESCGLPCDACNTLGAAGLCTTVPAATIGDATCGYPCNGTTAACPISSCVGDGHCAPTHYCPAHTCVPKQASGALCVANHGCLTGLCVDGVCCSSVCGPCAACNLAGSRGSCANVAAARPGAPSCSPYVCTGNSAGCPTGCTATAGCSTDYFCSVGVCVPRRAMGSTCMLSEECSSGHCADGFCCNTSCEDSCDACNLQNTRGTCTVVAAGYEGVPACAPYRCSTEPECPGSCKLDQDCASGHFCEGSVCKSPPVIDAGGTGGGGGPDAGAGGHSTGAGCGCSGTDGSSALWAALFVLVGARRRFGRGRAHLSSAVL
jgi:hypothetical protein